MDSSAQGQNSYDMPNDMALGSFQKASQKGAAAGVCA
jgi:hypothetical protein